MAKKEQKKFEVHMVPIDKLIPADYNPRQLDEFDRKEIKASLQKYGFVENTIVNMHEGREYTIIGGHQRIEIAKSIGITEVPCVFMDLSLDEEKELNIRLNKNGGKFDNDLLRKYFDKEFLLHSGFKENELDFFLSDFEKKFDKYNNKNCEMPIVPKFSEQYGAVIIIARNSIDIMYLKTLLNIERQKCYKCSRVQDTMIVDVNHVKKALEGKMPKSVIETGQAEEEKEG